MFTRPATVVINKKGQFSYRVDEHYLSLVLLFVFNADTDEYMCMDFFFFVDRLWSDMLLCATQRSLLV